jgi:FlaA1/EpsC-like NDP-sugar epimerase
MGEGHATRLDPFFAFTFHTNVLPFQITMKKVIIFGCSGFGKFVKYSLDDKLYEVVAFVDNCKELHGKVLHQTRVISPEEIVKHEFDWGSPH